MQEMDLINNLVNELPTFKIKPSKKERKNAIDIFLFLAGIQTADLQDCRQAH
jgi:hypothetical protein